MNNLNQSTKNFIEGLKTDPNLKGIILFGSWARGNNRPSSDVDLVVILEKGFQRKIDKLDGQVFEIIYTTAESALDFWKKNLNDAAGLWEVAKILYDRDGSIHKLSLDIKAILESGKPEINKLQKEQFEFDATDQINYAFFINSTDSTTANLILNQKVFDLTSKYFDLRQLWTPAPKQRLAKIKELDSELFKLIEDFYSEYDFSKKVELARLAVKIVFN